MVPFTFTVIMPANHKLLAPDRDLSSGQTPLLELPFVDRAHFFFAASVSPLIENVKLSLSSGLWHAKHSP
jgi:hypothetical protein